MKRVILFVCTGNICRSPMAEGLFAAHARRAGENDLFEVYSTGTWGMEDEPASGNAVLAMARRGIDISAHRSKMITLRDMEKSDAVIVMTRSHREALGAEFPHHRAKVHLMSELSDRIFDIGDPYGGTRDEYESTARQLENLIQTGYAKIKTWAKVANETLASHAG